MAKNGTGKEEKKGVDVHGETPKLGVPEIDRRVDALADELLAAGISPKQFITRYIFKWLESSKHVLGENWADRAKKRMDAIMAFVIDDLE